MTGPPTVLVVEGITNAAAVEPCLPPDITLLPLTGCRAWATSDTPPADLHPLAGHAVVAAFAMDIAGDPTCHAAAVAFTEAALAEGAVSVRYLTVPGGMMRLEAALLGRPEDRRAEYLANLVAQAKPRLPRKPRARAGDPADDDGFFDRSGLLVQRLCHAIVDRHPAALTYEGKVALYRNGVYHANGMAFSGCVAELLGDRFRPAHRAAAEEFAAGELYNTGTFLPERQETPLLNVRNGMLDLATGTLKPHDPVYMSSTQLPLEWDPDATCPIYEAWLGYVVDGQADDLEEVAATMLDPSRTPSKAAFLFGPSRSGKSTFLRLMQAVAGTGNYSAVTLHQLIGNRFAAANVYGKILNCAADLSSAHVEDMSMFKMMTGEDPVQADRKYGGQFSFVNRALFAFSANELPTVGESSRAYVERVKPFEFPRSFAGNENPAIETAMMRELPGVLCRWVRAWQRMADRGGYQATAAAVRHEFEVRSDRVRQFVAERCTIHLTLDPVAIFPADTADETAGTGLETAGSPESAGVPALLPGAEVPSWAATTKRNLAQAFNRWAEENKGSKLGERKVIDRLTSINGVVDVRRMPGAVRALNITLREELDETWVPEDRRTTTRRDLVPAVPAVLKALSGTLNTHTSFTHLTRDLQGLGEEGDGVFLRSGKGRAETAGSAGTAGPSPNGHHSDPDGHLAPTSPWTADLWENDPLVEPDEDAA